ncbi:protein PRRC2A-like isoform X3 [Colius striatus]|uniref:protein PRRC2A-like isoform X3 n=1 Tax=Colius striatus TaxID=57412 RepID=UPI002B1CF476|nr:protein PRRC2A-like isoform X3 [Colius striatus]
MFPPWGCRRGFPRKPHPWQRGPRAAGPHRAQDDPPWEHPWRRGRARWHLPGPWDYRPFPGSHGNEDRRWDHPLPPPWANREDNQGHQEYFAEDWEPPGPWYSGPFPSPDDFHGDAEDRRWAPTDHPLPPPRDHREKKQRPEDWHPVRGMWPGGVAVVWQHATILTVDLPLQPGPWDSRPFPGPVNFHGNEDRRQAPNEHPLPPPWDDRECNQGPEDWHPELLPGEEQHAPWPPSSLPGESEGFQNDWDYHGPGGRRCQRLRQSYRELTVIKRLPCPPWPFKRKKSSFKSSSHSEMSQPGSKDPSHPDPPQPPTTLKDEAESREQDIQVSTPAVSREVPEAPEPASTPPKSPAAAAQAVTEAEEEAAGATLVEPGAGQKPADSESPSASEMEPATLEKGTAGTGEHLEVEPCSPSVPEAAAAGGSHPPSPAAPPEPSEGVCTTVSTAAEVGAELCPWGQQHLLSGAAEAEAEDAHDELLSGLQTPENSQVPSGATTEPDAQPSQACSDTCTVPETSLENQHPPGAGETELAAGTEHQFCPTLPPPSLADPDLRSAAVLARKEEIELSYQQFSLTIAVVATMLLQKEPSMEAALGLALRANLRQGRIHHLRELEDFIDSYDSATLSP